MYASERSLLSNIRVQQKEWIYRGLAVATSVLVVWLGYRFRNDGPKPLLLLPVLAGAAIAILRLPSISGAIDSIEGWLRTRRDKATENQGKFARFVSRPFYAQCLFVWRCTAPIPDAHVRAGMRLAILIIVSAGSLLLLVTAAYVLFAIVIFLFVLAIAFWIFSLWAGSGSSDTITTVTRRTSDWLGRPKEVHVDGSGKKIGESRATTDWIGNPKTVHTDTRGNVVGESRPTKDWLGNPKTVHKDAAGNAVGESRPSRDWIGNPITVHTDKDGNKTGESREETDLLGRRKVVNYKR